MTNPPPPLILASTSPYRSQCLERLGISFATDAPEVEELREEGETPLEMALRLAKAKAEAVCSKHPGAAVIAGDQVLDIEGRDYGKPLTAANAIKQLGELAGMTGVFHCGTCVLCGDLEWHYSIPTEVRWRSLSEAEIVSYVEREPALGSAGSAQLEGMGIALVERMTSDDPTAILGVPLISLSRILRELGYALP